MVAQPAGRADDDMGAAFQRPPLAAHVHATDTGADRRAGQLVEPFQLAPHLQRQLPRRGHDQPQRRAGICEPFRAGEQARRQGKAEGNGLAGPGLGRDKRVGRTQPWSQHCFLHRCQLDIAAVLQRLCKRRHDRFETGHLSLSEFGILLQPDKGLLPAGADAPREPGRLRCSYFAAPPLYRRAPIDSLRKPRKSPQRTGSFFDVRPLDGASCIRLPRPRSGRARRRVPSFPQNYVQNHHQNGVIPLA